MAHDPLMLVVRTLHILAGVLWIGGVVFAGVVVGRSMADAPPQVKGPAMGRIGPVSFRVLSWAGALTIVFGVILQVLITNGGYSQTTWNMVIGLASLIAVAMMGIAGAVIGPTLKKMAAQPPPETAMALQKRMMQVSMLNIALGVVAVILMVYATSLRSQ